MISLYVKQHNQTGLKYFGYTKCKDPYKYNGSGIRWQRHIKKHGKDITTLQVFDFEDDQQLAATKFATQFSESHDIVVSNSWANCQIEDATQYVSFKGRKHKESSKKQTSDALKGRKQRPEWILKRTASRIANGNHIPSPESIEKRAAKLRGRIPHNKGIPMGEDQKIKLRAYARGKVQSICLKTKRRVRVTQEEFDASPYLVGSTSRVGMIALASVQI